MYIPPLDEGRHAARIAAAMAMPVFAPGMAAGAGTELSVFICFTNRCGSNFLGDLLAATGQLPRPGESFNVPAVVDGARAAGIASFDAYCRLLHEKRDKSGRFLAKAGMWQLAMLARLGYLGTLFPNPHFIHIQRYDTVAQAVSFLLARHTGEWSAARQTGGVDESAPYDRAKIAAHVKRIDRENVAIRQFLQVNRLRRLPVLYEHLEAMPDQVIAMIADWLGLGAVKIDPRRRRVVRQVSDVKRRYHDRYLEETAESGL